MYWIQELGISSANSHLLYSYNAFFTFEVSENIYLSHLEIPNLIMKFDFMKPWLPILIAVFSLMTSQSHAQDVHWTLFEYASLNSNPAQTGAFYGTYRIGGIVRDAEFASQNTNANGVTNVYGPAYTINIDGPIIRGFRKQDWVGVGATFYTDGAGDGNLSTSLSHISAAYHLALDKKQRTVLTFGLQGGMGTRKFKNFDGLIFPDGEAALGPNTTEQIMWGAGNVEINTNRNNRRELKNNGSVDINFGMLLKTKPNKTTNFEIGIVAKHFIPYRYGFNRDPDATGLIDTNAIKATKLPLNIGLQSGMDYKINKQWSVRPAAQFQLLSGAKPYFQFGGLFGYKLDPKKDMILKFGPGYRVGDAAQVLLGFEKGSIRAAMSYDMNLGELAAVSPFYGGGVEIAVSYIGTIFKQPELKPVIICPRY